MKDSPRKRKSPLAVILFFHAGFKPKDIIARGYSTSTVYSYSRKYKEALKEFQSRVKEGK